MHVGKAQLRITPTYVGILLYESIVVEIKLGTNVCALIEALRSEFLRPLN